MRYITAGESHGRVLTAIVSAVPAGVPIDTGRIDEDLERRQRGYGRGGRQAIETDRVTVLSGVRFGRTIGSPVALAITNRDWDNWLDVMSVSGDKPDGIRETQPRPGHADLAGILKIGSDDMRDVLERASARETAARVGAGGVAKAFLGELGISILSYVDSIGPVEMTPVVPSQVAASDVESSAVRCPDPQATELMKNAIDNARADGESLGGTFVVVVTGAVPGVGSYSEAARRLDARLAAAIVSIPAIKGVEFGDGFALGARPGSQAHDALRYERGAGIMRDTNRAGGLEGGMTNGETLVMRAVMKPIPTLMRPLASVNIDTMEAVDASRERSDVCAVPAAGVVAEAEVAMVLAAAYMEKFGADALHDIQSALTAYRERIAR